MKNIRSALLGSAAGLIAATTGQAADLPIKAKPVEYVKVCNLYGTGFSYMPGTEACLKVGGWVRAEVTHAPNVSASLIPEYNNDLNNRATSNLVARPRGYVTVDVREQTEYGTARAYLDAGVNFNDIGLPSTSDVSSFSSNRAFVQLGGLTAGLTQSFFDFYSAPSVMLRAAMFTVEDTGDTGWWVWAYTSQLGNGLTATISAEQRRITQVIEQTGAVAVAPGGPGIPAGAAGSNLGQGSLFATTNGAGYGGWQAPDVVANLRLEQNWGSAQLMDAIHELNPLYYGATANTGHPSDRWGFVLGAGLKVNFPTIAQGDYFQGELNYTQGALRYLNISSGNNFDYVNGGQEAFGTMSDCVYGGTSAGSAATKCNLTTAWSINASYEHFWTPQFHQSFVVAREQVSYNNQANNVLCAAAGDGVGTGALAIAAPGCNNNWSFWGIDTRLQYDVTKTFYVAVEAQYTYLDSATTSDGFLHGFAPPATALSLPTRVSNEHAPAFTVRMHRDFVP
jgi:hypothetical protein